MKFSLAIIAGLLTQIVFSQTLQLHYDARHTLAPKRNAKNYLTLYFEYFKNQDSGKSFIKPGSFLLKTQADFAGDKHNINNFYVQVTQSFRMWQPEIFVSLQYSGGLGVTEPKQYSYYIVNTFSAGVSYLFKWGSAYLSNSLSYKYVPYSKPSNDLTYSLYWWKGLWKYTAEFSGDFSAWTENKNHGDDMTKDLKGKRFFFFAEPQFWFHLNSIFALGTKVNMYYHVLTSENVFQVYPTLAIRCKL